MSWRSWNYYACAINATVFQRQIDALVARKRLVGGIKMSLLDLGYSNVGIDDCWQDCLSSRSINGSYHDALGSPLVDTARFPDGLRALTDYATSRRVSMGWYGNNCPVLKSLHPGDGRGPKYCGERDLLQNDWPLALRGDIAALKQYNFSAVKLDNPIDCGASSNLEAYFAAAKAAFPDGLVIENCHYNTTFPRWADGVPGGELLCPMALYRVSGDIKSNWRSVMSNVAKTLKYVL